MRRNIGGEKLLNVNSFTSKKLIMEISIRRIREAAQDTAAGATAEAAVPRLGGGRGDGRCC